MATSVNNTLANERKEAIKEVAKVSATLEEVSKTQNANLAEVEKTVNKSGLALRMESHFARLTLVELSDKNTFIVLKSTNIPTTVDVVFSKNSKNGVDINVRSRAITHTSENDLTVEQEEANTIICNYTDKLTSATKGYVKQIMDICRTWEELYAVAIQQREDAKRALWKKYNNIVENN